MDVHQNQVFWFFQGEASLALQGVDLAAFLVLPYANDSPTLAGERWQEARRLRRHFLTSSMMPPTFMTRTGFPLLRSGVPLGKETG